MTLREGTTAIVRPTDGRRSSIANIRVTLVKRGRSKPWDQFWLCMIHPDDVKKVEGPLSRNIHYTELEEAPRG